VLYRVCGRLSAHSDLQRYQRDSGGANILGSIIIFYELLSSKSKNLHLLIRDGKLHITL
jgi:hypothetical protein